MGKYKFVGWETKDPDPHTVPPSNGVLGYWPVGRDNITDRPVVYALVKASSEEQAIEIVKDNWPSFISWQFCNDREVPFGTAALVPTDWMLKRIRKEAENGNSNRRRS